MESITDSMPPGSVFVPQVIVERRWKCTRFLIILGIIMLAAYTFTPYDKKLWVYDTLMVIATVVWGVAFIARILLTDRCYIANRLQPPWFEFTGTAGMEFVSHFVPLFFLALIDAYLTTSYLRQDEPADTWYPIALSAFTLILLALLFRITLIISPRLRATKLGRIAAWLIAC